MVKAIEFLPKIRYSERPAFKLLLGCMLGVLLFSLDWIHTGSIIIAILCITLFVLSLSLNNELTQIRLQELSFILLFAILFAWYAEIKTAPIHQLPKGVTLYDTEVQILYPTASSLESEKQFNAKVYNNGRWYNVRLKTPTNELLPEEYHYGSQLIATLDLASLKSIKNKGYRNYLLSEGIEAQGTIQSIQSIHLLKHRPLQSKMRLLRHRLINSFESISSHNKILGQEERGLIYALSLGERSYLPQEIKTAFTSSGVAHILAVSGYHLGVVFALLSLFLNRILPHYPQRKLRYALLLVGLFSYTFLSGASTSTVRALVMSTLALSARFLDRPTDPIQLLSVTMIFFLMLNPYAYLSVGLLLSISAVWGIFLFFPLLQEFLSTSIKPLQYVLDIVLVSISAQIGVFPILLYYFGTATFTFIWSNVPLVIISGLLIPLALVVLITLPIVGGLPDIIFNLLKWLSSSMIEVTDLFSSLSSGINIRFDLPLVVLYYLFFVLLYPLLHRTANQHRIDRGTA